MISTDKFVFIHMHKTGGQSLNHVIEQCMPKIRHIGYHYPFKLLPAECAQLPIVGLVRNPWDWYVSWYAFNTRLIERNPLFFILSDGLQADFKKTIKNLINLGSDEPGSREHRIALTTMLPDTLEGNRGVGLSKDCIYQFSNNQKGYYSWLFERMHGDLDNKNLHIGLFENLQEEFISIMDSLSVPETDAMRTKFAATRPMNASSHSHYSRYYDDELRELVAEKEKSIIERYHYEFETGDDRSATIEFPSVQMGGIKDNFQKLDGKANNFLLLHPDFDIQAIKQKIAEVPEEVWSQSGREKEFEVHRQTQALLIIYDDDFRHYKPTCQPL